MSKATKGTSTLFPQVSRGESNDAAKGLLDDAGDSSGDEAHYQPWSFADAAATAALPAKCSSSAPFGATFADDRRLATRFQDIAVTNWL